MRSSSKPRRPWARTMGCLGVAVANPSVSQLVLKEDRNVRTVILSNGSEIILNRSTYIIDPRITICLLWILSLRNGFIG